MFDQPGYDYFKAKKCTKSEEPGRVGFEASTESLSYRKLGTKHCLASLLFIRKGVRRKI
jgi:hypothetical protein